MLDIEHARSLVKGWPVTVERYSSGHLGFVARPQISGQRFNRSFSTSKWKELPDAAQAAIEYCRETLRLQPPPKERYIPEIPLDILSECDRVIHDAYIAGFDPVEAFREGIRILAERRASRLNFDQVVENFLASKQAKNSKQEYLRDLSSSYRTFAEDFGDRPIDDISSQQIEHWLTTMERAGRIKSSITWNNWLRELGYVWDFALLSGKGWVTSNVVKEVPKK